jgi:hypothetical protein
MDFILVFPVGLTDLFADEFCTGLEKGTAADSTVEAHFIYVASCKLARVGMVRTLCNFAL